MSKEYKLKIAGFETPAFDNFVYERMFDKYNIKYNLSLSKKTVIFEEQIIKTDNELAILQIANIIIKNSPNIYSIYEDTFLSLNECNYYKFIVEHDIILDLFDNMTKSNITEVINFFKESKVSYSFDDVYFKIKAQKIILDFKYIDTIIKYISYGSKSISKIEYQGHSTYTISQRDGYHKSLDIIN